MHKKLVLICFTLLLFTSCKNQNQENQDFNTDVTDQVINDKDDIELLNLDDETETIQAHLDKIKYLNTEDALVYYENLEVMVTGKCISVQTVFQNSTMYTVSTIQVSQVYKGDISSNEIISIVEMGGKTTHKEYIDGCNIPKKSFVTESELIDDNTPVVLNFDGFYAMQENDEILLFLADSTGFIKSLEGKLYSVVGDFDGKLYKQEENIYSRPIYTDYLVSRLQYTTLTIDVNNLSQN